MFGMVGIEKTLRAARSLPLAEALEQLFADSRAFTGGQGALVSASRSILYAHREKKYADISGDWEKCVERAVMDMKKDLADIAV